jgi:phospholipid/cholesterol/gamma-HCH transport system substrate-binding protein
VLGVELQGWHAVITLRLDGDVQLRDMGTAGVGQTSLLGSLHIELAPPTDVPPEGRLSDGALIPFAAARSYPTTEDTLAAVSTLLNGGGLGQAQDIIRNLTIAFGGREAQLRDLLAQLDEFVAHLTKQTDGILAATASINDLAGQFAGDRPVIDRALQTVPAALEVLKDQRKNLSEALDQLGRLSALAAHSVNQTKDALVQELKDLSAVLKSLADAGPALTRSLSLFATFPYPRETITKWQRGDYGNLTAVLDLTLSRIDAAMFTGTRWEGNLTTLELQWGRTIGQMPSPYTAGNPLVAPYNWDTGGR